MMTSKERVMATINFEPVDRPAVFPLEGSAWACMRAGISYKDLYAMPDYGAQILVDAFNDMESDAVFAGGSAWIAWVNAFGGSVKNDVVGGPLTVEPAFKEAEDIPELTNEEIKEKLLANFYVQTMINQIKAVKAIVGEEKAVMPGHTGPFTGAAMLVGPEKFMLFLGKRDPAVDKLIDLAARALAIYADILIDAGADIMNVCDPVASGDMVSMMTYKKVALKGLKLYNETIEHKDIKRLVHICGKAGERVDIVRDWGASMFSVDSMVDMEDMIKRCDKKMVMVGNINPSDVMLLGTPEMVYDNAMKLFELADSLGGRVIPATGCELPAQSPLENIKMLAKAAKDFAAK